MQGNTISVMRDARMNSYGKHVGVLSDWIDESQTESQRRIFKLFHEAHVGLIRCCFGFKWL